MSTSEVAQIVEQYHRALNAFVNGDATPEKEPFSRRDDATLANPLGPPVRGWKQVGPALERAASWPETPNRSPSNGSPTMRRRIWRSSSRSSGSV